MGTIDMSSATAPPKRKTSNPRASKQAAEVVSEEPVTRVGLREQGLNGLARLGMGLCSVMGLYADSATIGQFFPPISHELAVCAEANETIAKPIDFLINIGPYGALLTVVMPFAMQMAANHGLIDANKAGGLGVMPPEVMEARAKAQMLQMAAQAKRAQNEALIQAQAAQKEFEEAMGAAA